MSIMFSILRGIISLPSKSKNFIIAKEFFQLLWEEINVPGAKKFVIVYGEPMPREIISKRL